MALRRVEPWVISRAFHEDRSIAEVLVDYIDAGIDKTPKRWDSKLQLAAGKAAGFGGKDESKRVSARTRAEGLVQLGWLERAGGRGSAVIHVTDLGEAVAKALSGPPAKFDELVQGSRLNLKCIASGEELKGQEIFPSLTVEYVLEQLAELAGESNAYITKEDLRFFLLWSWDAPQTTEGARALKRMARTIHSAHQTGNYPKPINLPKHDPDASRHFIANFDRTGLFRWDGTRLFLARQKGVASERVAGRENTHDKMRVAGRPPLRQGRAETHKIFLDVEHVAADIAEPPARVAGTVSRIVRNTTIIKQLKELYEYSCQVCGTYIFVSGNKFYCEGHHLQPLGSPHDGADNSSNVLILCPNHHAMFDLGAMAISPADGQTLKYIDPTAEEQGRTLNIQHRIAHANVVYHYENIWQGEKA